MGKDDSLRAGAEELLYVANDAVVAVPDSNQSRYPPPLGCKDDLLKGCGIIGGMLGVGPDEIVAE